MRPFGRSRPPSSSASSIRSSLERLISISCAQRSSGIFAIVRSLGDAGVVDDDVDAVGELLGDPLRARPRR